MHKLFVAFAIAAIMCGCRSDDVSGSKEPIVSPTNISNQSGSGEIQIPHYVPTWYEK